MGCYLAVSTLRVAHEGTHSNATATFDGRVSSEESVQRVGGLSQ